jgi:uncharacterized circularly permuted ATP-grasp superfamily protein
VSETDWNEIRAGIEQRVDLLERILSDVYGPAKLIAEGALPAAAIAGSPDFVRAMRGVKPPGGRWIRLYAADIGRGPDGRWWVLGDRAQAPSGAGYALENRLVLSRAFAGLYRDMNVERLAPFFRDFRTGLAQAALRSEPRICLLTPGAWSETYFEQAYLARYLGMLLVEGEDLVMSEGRLHVRTIAGLKRADVIWRRIDADWCDPLELNAASQLGVPGMLEAIRRGEVVVANMPGAGLIESRALLAFLPALARRVLGEDLRLPNIATWWCGQEQERKLVLDQFDEMTISGAFSETVPGLGGARDVLGSDLGAAERKALISAIHERGMDFAGQEVVRLSTTPVWSGGALAPRPFSLRVYAAATPDGWRVMPGGFCRVSGRSDVRAVNMGEGAQSADAWVIGEKPVEISTLLPTADNVKIVRLLGNLPSRAADNLFWFGRYLERAEATLRLVRTLCGRIMDADMPAHGGRQSIERLQRILAAWGAAPPGADELRGFSIAAALRSEEAYGSALSIARAARRAASVIRERLSQDAWQLVGRLETRKLTLRRLTVSTARPSCGTRCSETSISAMIFRRAVTADCSALGMSTSGWSTPSMRVRMRISFSSGSKWMSLARRWTARVSTWLTSWMIGASSALASAVSALRADWSWSGVWSFWVSSMTRAMDCWIVGPSACSWSISAANWAACSGSASRVRACQSTCLISAVIPSVAG